MSGFFGGKHKKEPGVDRSLNKAHSQHLQIKAADQYDDMVTKALERLTRWAFPDSQVERQGTRWHLWHLTESGKKYIDVAVELQFDDDQPESFICSESLYYADAELTREDLDNALRRSICSVSG